MDERELETLREGLRLFAWRELRDPDDVEDVVQETLSRVLARMRQGGDIENLGGLARTIARNVIADLYRARKHDAGAPPAEFADPPDPRPDPLDSLVTEEEKARLRAALDRLPAKDRELLRLVFVEEMKPGEVAGMRGEPPERVRQQLHRALRKLRELYDSPPDGHDRRPDTTDETDPDGRMP